MVATCFRQIKMKKPAKLKGHSRGEYREGWTNKICVTCEILRKMPIEDEECGDCVIGDTDFGVT